MRVEDIMTAPAVTAKPEDTVQMAAVRLAGSDIGVLPICEASGRLLGIVTDRDLVIRCIAKGKDPKTTSLGEIMTAEPVGVEPRMDALMAAGLMGRKRLHRLPVLKEGIIQGVLSISDIAAVESMDAGDALAQITAEENF